MSREVVENVDDAPTDPPEQPWPAPGAARARVALTWSGSTRRRSGQRVTASTGDCEELDDARSHGAPPTRTVGVANLRTYIIVHGAGRGRAREQASQPLVLTTGDDTAPTSRRPRPRPSVGTDAADVTWSASTDTAAVTGYRVSPQRHCGRHRRRRHVPPASPHRARRRCRLHVHRRCSRRGGQRQRSEPPRCGRHDTGHRPHRARRAPRPTAASSGQSVGPELVGGHRQRSPSRPTSSTATGSPWPRWEPRRPELDRHRPRLDHSPPLPRHRPRRRWPGGAGEQCRDQVTGGRHPTEHPHRTDEDDLGLHRELRGSRRPTTVGVTGYTVLPRRRRHRHDDHGDDVHRLHRSPGQELHLHRAGPRRGEQPEPLVGRNQRHPAGRPDRPQRHPRD